jgi:hypothetical protein
MTAEEYLKEAERLAGLKDAAQDDSLRIACELMEQSYRALAANALMLERLKARQTLAAKDGRASASINRLAS